MGGILCVGISSAAADAPTESIWTVARVQGALVTGGPRIGGRVLGLVLACASLSLVGIWLNVSGRGGVLVESYSETGQAVFYGCRLASLLLLIAFHGPIYRNAARVSVMGCSLMVLGTMVRIVAAQPINGASYDGMVLVGYALSGLGYMPCLFLLYYGLARTFDLTSALIVTLLAMVCKEQGPALVSLLPENARIWALLGIVVLMMGALTAFWGACRALPPDSVCVRVASVHEWRDLWYLVALGAISSLSVFFFNSVSHVGLAGAATSVASSATSGVISTLPGKIVSLLVCVGLGYFTVVCRAHRPLAVRFVPAFVAIALSSALATVASMMGGALAMKTVETLLLGVYDFNQYLSWALLVCVVRRGQATTIRGFTAVFCMHELLATFVGPLSVDVSSASGSVLTIVFGLLVTVLAGIVLPFAMMKHATWVPATGSRRALPSAVYASVETNAPAFAGEGSLLNAATPGHLEPRLASEIDDLGFETAGRLADVLRERCRYVAGLYGLTEREGEVFYLLCQGQSRLAICQRLCMSEGTVKTHIAHIYEKTGVNTREALSDLVFAQIG